MFWESEMILDWNTPTKAQCFISAICFPQTYLTEILAMIMLTPVFQMSLHFLSEKLRKKSEQREKG